MRTAMGALSRSPRQPACWRMPCDILLHRHSLCNVISITYAANTKRRQPLHKPKFRQLSRPSKPPLSFQ